MDANEERFTFADCASTYHTRCPRRLEDDTNVVLVCACTCHAAPADDVVTITLTAENYVTLHRMLTTCKMMSRSETDQASLAQLEMAIALDTVHSRLPQ